MERPGLAGQIVSAIVARLDVGGEAPSSAIGGVGDWVVTITSILAVLAVGGAAARVARRLPRRSAPELIVLLNQSAAFYGRWPEDRLASAPRAAVMEEAVRCRRIIELLESATNSADGPASRGPIDGLRAWAALVQQRSGGPVAVAAGTAYV